MFQQDLIARPAERFRQIQVLQGSWIIVPAARPGHEELDASVEGTNLQDGLQVGLGQGEIPVLNC
jgi:hypothetical protein